MCHGSSADHNIHGHHDTSSGSSHGYAHHRVVPILHGDVSVFSRDRDDDSNLRFCLCSVGDVYIHHHIHCFQ